MANQKGAAGWVVAVSLLLCLLVTTGVGSARASNSGSAGSTGTTGTTSGVWWTTSQPWWVIQRSLTDKYETGVTWALNNQYAPTDLNVVNVANASTCSVNDGHDACVFDSDYGDNGLNGWNACAGTTTGSHPNQTCKIQYVRINLFFDPPARRIACHELGHSVGLRHTSDGASCMKRSADGGTSEVLTTHDQNELNDYYP